MLKKADPRWVIAGGIVTVLLVVAGIAILPQGTGTSETGHQHGPVEKQDGYWTCSMHPQIKMDHPGKCPLCAMDLVEVKQPAAGQVSQGERKIKYWVAPMDPTYKRDTPGKSPMGMDLVPVYEEEAGGEEQRNELTLSPRAEKLAEVETSPVLDKSVAGEVSLTGKLDFDETRYAKITARFPGRIEELFADYTETYVTANDRLFSVYSPELIVAQQELIDSRRNAGIDAGLVRQKLRLWGLSKRQIDRIETQEAPDPRFTVYAPHSGLVVEKHITEGVYVKTGTPLYTLANPAYLWLYLDVYESDLAKVTTGTRVSFQTDAYPGETFEGTVSFIGSAVDPKTRTVRVRADVHSPDRRLKPNMLARASLTGTPGADGTLVIPATAPLITGKRAVVYVKDPNTPGTYEGRIVTLGQRVGEFYVVKSGLSAGELVVTNGNFKIDSAMQIKAKASMMDQSAFPGAQEHSTPETAEAEHTPLPAAAEQAAIALTDAYFGLQQALSSDDNAAAQQYLSAMVRHSGKLEGSPHYHKVLAAVRKLEGAASLEEVRRHFDALSRAVSAVAAPLEAAGSTPVYRFSCAMAQEGAGAVWLQQTHDTRNPYFGQSMLTCGERIKTI